MAAPPKPWQRPGVNQQSSASIFENAMSSGPQTGSVGTAIGGPAAAFSATTTTSAPPAPPPRPSSSTVSRPTYGGYGTYGSGYGGPGSMYGAGSMYSPYSGMGRMGGMGAYGSYGYNRFGMQGDVPGSSFVRMAEENSRPAFQSIESIVHAVNSVSMMLDSSFQAVYSSFRAVIGVADNFSRLRSQMVQIFSALAMIRTLKYLIRRFLELLRLRPSGQAEREWREAFAQAAGAVPAGEDGSPKKSAWPIFMFFGIILGGPWLIWKLISSLSSSQEGEEAWSKGEADHVVAQALHSFSRQGEEDLSFSAGQLLILAPKERQPQVRGWLLASVEGRKGLVPYNYIKILGKRRGRQTTTSVAGTPNQSAAGAALPAVSSASMLQSTFSSQSAGPAGDLNPEMAVPDMDSIFASTQDSSGMMESDSVCFSEPEAANQHSDGTSAADIVEKKTGE
ncbi:hypothetical protein ACOMHN_026020 [Nucella lapillus]